MVVAFAVTPASLAISNYVPDEVAMPDGIWIITQSDTALCTLPDRKPFEHPLLPEERSRQDLAERTVIGDHFHLGRGQICFQLDGARIGVHQKNTC